MTYVFDSNWQVVARCTNMADAMGERDRLRELHPGERFHIA